MYVWLSGRRRQTANLKITPQVRILPHTQKKFKNMTEELRQYLWTEFKFNNLPKYYKYFDTWIENLTENQILYYNAYSKGKKSPYAN